MTKDKMIKYVGSFDKYPTMNSWNGSYGYSINMKVHNLPLRQSEKDKLYEVIGDECLSSEFYSRIQDDIENWRWDNEKLFGYHTTKDMMKEINFDAGFNGRMGGHLVLYKWNGYNMAGTGWYHDKEELEEMSKEDVRYIYKVLKAFEKLSQMLIETGKAMAQEEVVEEEYTITKTRKVFKNTL